MRDSTNRLWDEQFVDQGWSNMRQLLDEELPVAGAVPRRRVGAMLVIFLLGLVFGGVGIIYLVDRPAIGYFPIPQRAVAFQERPTTQLPVVQAEALPADALKEETNVSGRTTAEKNEGTVIPAQTGQETLIAHKDDGRISEISETQDNNLRPPSADLPVLTATDVPVTPAIIPPVEPATVEVGSQQKDVPALMESLAFPAFGGLQLLPEAELSAWSSRDTLYAETLLLPPVIASVDARGVQWGAELGSNYYQDPGYFGGVQVSYELGGRWGLQSGLQYGQIVSGLDDARRAANSSFSQEAMRDPNSNLNTNVDQPGASRVVPDYFDINIRLQQLSAPVLATYQLSRKWQLGAGVQMHYLLAARRPAQEIVANDNAVAPSFSAYDRALTGLAAADNTVEMGLLQNWNLGAVLGTAFQPTERWSFNLRFQYGFFNWLESDRFLITPTNLQFSAVYLIGK